MITEFNLELAKSGAKLVTRDGKEARLLCSERVDSKYYGNLVVLVKNTKGTWERIIAYNNQGRVASCLEKNLDLMIQDGR